VTPALFFVLTMIGCALGSAALVVGRDNEMDVHQGLTWRDGVVAGILLVAILYAVS